jgi:hypothetical protein
MIGTRDYIQVSIFMVLYITMTVERSHNLPPLPTGSGFNTMRRAHEGRTHLIDEFTGFLRAAYALSDVAPEVPFTLDVVHGERKMPTRGMLSVVSRIMACDADGFLLRGPELYPAAVDGLSVQKIHQADNVSPDIVAFVGLPTVFTKGLPPERGQVYSEDDRAAATKTLTDLSSAVEALYAAASPRNNLNPDLHQIFDDNPGLYLRG